MSRRRLLRIAITGALLAVVAYFFGRGLVQNWTAVLDIDVVVNAWSVGAVLLFALAVVCSGLLWGRMVVTLGDVHVGVLESIRVHCASWLLKYVPGQVGSVANKVAWSAARGISRTLVLISFVYENVFLLLGSIVPSVMILLFADSFHNAGEDLWGRLVPALVAVGPLLLVMDRRLFRWAVNLVGRRALKRDVPPEYFLSPSAALRYQFAFLLPRIINGGGFVMIVVSFLDVPASSYVPLAATYVLAGAVGILAVFVPSGLGVREGIIVLLASQYMPVEQAIVLSLVARLYSTVADAVVAGIYALLRAHHYQEGRSA